MFPSNLQEKKRKNLSNSLFCSLEERIFEIFKKRCNNYYQPQKKKKAKRKKGKGEGKLVRKRKRNWTVYFSPRRFGVVVREAEREARGGNEKKTEREREKTNQGKSASWIWVKSGGRSWNQASRAKTANVPRKVASRR